MAVDRPTFSESWYRVADLRPSLRTTVRVHRQHFRGQMWHVLQDPTANQFFRLNAAAYTFVAMLDGRRTVAEVWRICNDRLGDEAPTQGEAIHLLGQLYTSNLLQAELPPDAEGLLRRYRKRRVREVQGRVTNLLFIHIPLIDPDHFLDRWVGVLGRMFTWFGLAVWFAIVGVGLYFVAGRSDELANKASGIFDPANLIWLYTALIITKVFHEFGHAFACKAFGRRTGRGGEVHVMGVMFLVFMPLPYVDASSAWAFRSKWHRVVVGAAGIFVELAIAAAAAVIWANTAEGTTGHAVCYNIMFLSGVSTVLFNGNPLLKYDAYYVLSDLLEIPNLAERARLYLYYLVKRHAWSVRRVVNPAHTRGEAIWFVLYGVASTVYRILIFGVILLFLTDRLPKFLAVIAIAFGLVAAFTWICVPLGKFIRYLATSTELDRVRSRASASALSAAVLILIGVGGVSFPDRFRVEGVVEPVDMAVIYAEADGFLEDYLPSGRQVAPDGPALVRCANVELGEQYAALLAERKKLEVKRRIGQTKEPAAEKIVADEIAALDEKISKAKKELASLEPRAPLAGMWVSPDIDAMKGAYAHRGDKLGLVAKFDQLTIRATAGQSVAAMVINEAYNQVEIRVKGRPDSKFAGKVAMILQAGQEELPSAALGYQAGGAMQTSLRDDKGTRSAERFFEIRITPDRSAALWTGQRVVVRFTAPAKPLLVQWWRSLSQLLQRRFHV